jgi:two-component system, NarL family, sensor histidine kinase DesK
MPLAAKRWLTWRSSQSDVARTGTPPSRSRERVDVGTRTISAIPAGVPGRESPLWYVGMLAFVILLVIAIQDVVTSEHHTAVLIAALLGVAFYAGVLGWFATSRPVGQPIDATPWLLVVAAVAVAITTVVPQQGLFVVAVGALGGLYLPRRRAVVAIAGAVGAHIVFLLIADEPLSLVVGSAAQAAAIGFFCYGWARLEETNAALQAAREEVARLAVADERVRFARELHDLLGHTLSVIRVKSELAARLADVDPERAAAEMAEVERVARAALSEVREAVSGYRPGLALELQNADATLTGLGIDATVDADGVELVGAVGETLAWIVREAATNVVRHSGAHRCSISLRRSGDVVVLEVEDDGAGHAEVVKEGSGLRGMRERVGAVGGQVAVDTGPGAGFRLRVVVPAPAS